MLLRPLSELPGPGGRGTQRARLPTGGGTGPERGPAKCLAVAGLRPDGAPDLLGQPVLARGLLLQNLHQAAIVMADLRAGHQERGWPWQGIPPGETLSRNQGV